MNTIPALDILNLSLAIVAAFLLVKIILRTEKDLDKASKCFFAAAISFVFVTIFQLNFFLRLVTPDTLDIAVRILRLMALASLVSGSYFLLRITERES